MSPRGWAKGLGPGRCVVCGGDFIRKTRVNVCCTNRCSTIWKNTQRNDACREAGGGVANQNVSIHGRTQSRLVSPRCCCPGHLGERFLPRESFYEWDSLASGSPCISGWCRECLKKWILENDWSDAHGQSMQADDLARLELCEARETYELEEGVDALTMAMRLVKEVS